MLVVCTLMIVTWNRVSLSNAKIYLHFGIAIKRCRERDRRAAVSAQDVYIEMTMAIVETWKISENAFAWYICANFVSSCDADTSVRFTLITNRWIFPSRDKWDSKKSNEIFACVCISICNNIFYTFIMLLWSILKLRLDENSCFYKNMLYF